MFEKLHQRLAGIKWKYHVLETFDDHAIVLNAVSLDPNGISEVMYIKEIADSYFFHTHWDGQNIRIVQHTKG